MYTLIRESIFFLGRTAMSISFDYFPLSPYLEHVCQPVSHVHSCWTTSSAKEKFSASNTTCGIGEAMPTPLLWIQLQSGR